MSTNQLGAVVASRSWIIGTRNRTAADPASTADNPVLGGPLPAWQAGYAYAVGNAVVNGANVYVCTVAGTSAASGGPTGTGAITTTTTAAVAAGVTVIPVTSATGMAANMPIAATGIPVGATIVSIAALNVTISAATLTGGVALGATVTVTAPIADGSVDWQFLGAGSGGSLFLHEYGWSDNGAPRAATGAIYAESGAITLGEGDQRYNVTQLVFDAACSIDDMLGYSFTVRENPYDEASEFDTGLYTVVHNGLMDMRWSGRTAQMRVEPLYDGDFAIGRPRLVMKPGGKR
jgi:hypothetical protein